MTTIEKLTAELERINDAMYEEGTREQTANEQGTYFNGFADAIDFLRKEKGHTTFSIYSIYR